MSVFDETDLVDRELPAGQQQRAPSGAAPAPSTTASRPPTHEELEVKLSQTQNRIAALRRAQEALERERVALEEDRRRRHELRTGREEMLQNLTRGIGLLEKAEFETRRDAEQMAKRLTAFREALAKVNAINEETWTTENLNAELTRALTVVENARMEWNAARLKWTVLNSNAGQGATAAGPGGRPAEEWLAQRSLWGLCRLGLAFTWPLALAILLAFGALVIILCRR
jgi:hypothetical protein